MDKVKHILQALDRMGRKAYHYALDLSTVSVRHSVDTISSILLLGSPIGNLTDTEAVKFLESFAGPVPYSKKSCTDQRMALILQCGRFSWALIPAVQEQQVRAAYIDPFGAIPDFC